MADYLLMAQYPKAVVVRDRNYGGLIAWAAYITAQPIPATRPEQIWVEQYILAGRIPTQATVYVERTIGYFLQDPTTQTNIRQYLSQWNDESAEVALSDQISAVLSGFMPAFAAGEISQSEVDQWYLDHGFDTAPLAAAAAAPRPPGPAVPRR
jgi:hypothetical protein